MPFTDQGGFVYEARTPLARRVRSAVMLAVALDPRYVDLGPELVRSVEDLELAKEAAVRAAKHEIRTLVAKGEDASDPIRVLAMLRGAEFARGFVDGATLDG